MPEWLNVLLRSAGLFIGALFTARLLGRRQTAQLTLFDLIAAVVLGVIAASISLNLISLINGLVALAVWTVMAVGVFLLSLKYKAVREIVQGRETILINHGKVLEDKLMEAKMTPEDLISKLRQKNVFQAADVEFALLEPNGDVSVFLKKDKQPLDAKTMGLNVAQQTVPQTVMLDGEIMDEPLTAMGLNRNWLHTELEKVGVAPENVFIGQVDSTGQLYLDLFDDAIQVPKPKAKEMAYYTLKKCQADCEMFAHSTENQDAKKMYAHSAEELKEILNDLKPVLLK
ncbi:MAG: DUF421 domain-containing protein [Desulfotomaculum sp.]|nr:DUF421 domain-containing protein [Desulfotomaculum sp.]